MKSSGLSRHAMRRALIVAAVSIASSSPLFAADINVGSGSTIVIGSRTPTVTNFGGFTQNGFASISGDNTSATVTTNATAEAGTVWSGTPLNVTDANGFSANFVYTPGGDMNADGATFSIQNDPTGSAAVGGQGPGLGVQGLTNIVSYEINLFIDPGTVVNFNGNTGHINGTAYQPTDPVQVNSGDPIAVSLNYANGVMVEYLRDTITGDTYATGYTFDLNSVLGGNSGYIGFTGGTGGLSATQTFSNFSFSNAAPTSQILSGSTLNVSDGGSIIGVAGSLSAPVWNVTGGNIAAGDIAVSFTTVTQSGGNISLGNIVLNGGVSYSISGGASTLASISILPGGSLGLSGGTLSTNSITNSGSFSWTAGTLHINSLVETSIDNTNLGSVVAINPGMSLIVDQGAHIAAGTIFILNGGLFFPNSMTNDGMVFLNSGTFHMFQDLNIGDGGPVGPQLFVGSNLTVLDDNTLHVQPEGSMIVSGGTSNSSPGGTVVASFVHNEGTISVSDANFTASFASENDGIIDAIRSFVTFGGGDEQMINLGTLNLIDTTVYGDLHNTSGALMRTAGGVTFNGNVTSDAPVELEGVVQFNGDSNALAAINGSADVYIAPSAVLTTGSATAHSFNVGGSLVLQPGTVSSPISGIGSIIKQGSGSTTLNGNAYTATGPVSVSQGTLAFSNTTNARQAPGVLLKMSSLSVSPNAVVDTTNHDLIIGNTSETAVTNEIFAGFGAGSPGDPEITSSTALANGNTFLVPLDATEFGIPSWDGVNVDQPNSVVVKYTYFGDATLDGQVNIDDLGAVIGNFGATTPGVADVGLSWIMGDMALEGTVGIDDLGLVISNFGLGVSSGTLGSLDGSAAEASGVAPALGGSSPVPEPASLALLGIGAMAVLLRRKMN